MLVQTLILPAAISLSIFLALSYVLVPIWQKHRAKYSRYLPLETISTQTTSLRQRVQSAIARWVLPSVWRSEHSNWNGFAVSAEDNSDTEEGEELYDIDERRREALSLDASRIHDGDGRRLSRDLEEGFRDDSDEETPTTGTQHR